MKKLFFILLLIVLHQPFLMAKHSILDFHFEEAFFVMLKPEHERDFPYKENGLSHKKIIYLSHKIRKDDFKYFTDLFSSKTKREYASLDISFSPYRVLFYKNKELIGILSPNILGGDIGFYNKNEKQTERINTSAEKNFIQMFLRFSHLQVWRNTKDNGVVNSPLPKISKENAILKDAYKPIETGFPDDLDFDD